MVTRRFVFAPVAVVALVAVATLGPQAGAQSVELLDFYLPTCGPCREMAPTVARLEAEGVAVRRVDGSREPQLAAQLRVESYPTFVAVADGREVGRVVGVTSYDDLRRLVSVAAPAAAVRPASHTFAPPPREAAASAPSRVGAGDAKLLSTAVRLTVVEGNGRSYGTGTVIDARSGEALVLTCAHLFRDADGKLLDPTGRLTIELFDVATGALRVAERVEGQLISHDFDADVALVAIRPSGAVPTARVAASAGDLHVSDAVRSVGCDLGADPTVRTGQIVDLNRYDGPPNIEASGAPVQGRSGGGLFNAAGEVIGVCNFADEAADEGIYAGLASIQAQLDRIGLADLYRNGGAPAAGATLVSAPAAAGVSRPLAPIERSPVVRGQSPVAPLAPIEGEPTLTSGEEATLAEIVSRGEKAEVVVLIRPDSPGGRTEVLTLDAASPEFVAALRRLGATR